VTIPADIERCRGFGDGSEDWLRPYECHTCQRRTAAGGEVFKKPPSAIAFFCEFFISEDES
jgi:hypothetical protein